VHFSWSRSVNCHSPTTSLDCSLATTSPFSVTSRAAADSLIHDEGGGGRTLMIAAACFQHSSLLHALTNHRLQPANKSVADSGAFTQPTPLQSAPPPPPPFPPGRSLSKQSFMVPWHHCVNVSPDRSQNQPTVTHPRSLHKSATYTDV